MSERIIQEQIDYYKARAVEYDQWFFRQGRYDHGSKLNQEWFDEVEEMRKALHDSKPSGLILELACGTGLWTKLLIQYCKHLSAIDSSEEMININKNIVKSSKVTYYIDDIFQWNPGNKYDFIFFGFWLSHVPEKEC